MQVQSSSNHIDQQSHEIWNPALLDIYDKRRTGPAMVYLNEAKPLFSPMEDHIGKGFVKEYKMIEKSNEFPLH